LPGSLHDFQVLACNLRHATALHFVLFGFRVRWALHLRRSPSNHSYGYAFSVDRRTCFAQRTLIPKPFMQHAG
jgi:hypothetical protein